MGAAVQLGALPGLHTRTATKSSFDGGDICQLETEPAARHQLQRLKGKHFSEASLGFCLRGAWRRDWQPLKRTGGLHFRGGNCARGDLARPRLPTRGRPCPPTLLRRGPLLCPSFTLSVFLSTQIIHGHHPGNTDPSLPGNAPHLVMLQPCHPTALCLSRGRPFALF